MEPRPIKDLLRERPYILSLDHRRLSDADIDTLARSTTLHSLHLTNNAIGNAGAIALARNTTLRMLVLEGDSIGDVGAVALAQTATLDTLYLCRNAIGDAGICAFAHNTSLKTIRLYGNAISDAGAITLAESLEAGNACALSPSDMRCVKRHIGQHAHRELSRFVGAGNRSLQFVFLSGNTQISAETVGRIEEALRVRNGVS